MSRLADLLRQQMDMNGWGKRELERETGVKRASIDHILDNDDAVPRLDTLDKFSKRFRMPLGHLIRLCGYEPNADDADDDELMRRLSAVMSAMPQFRPIIDQMIQLDSRGLDSLVVYLEVLQRHAGK
jgi:hypothetical protein